MVLDQILILIQNKIMKHERPLIAGGGPAGLTAAYHATKKGYKPLVLEASGCVGGISRTEEHQGFRFDIGGHRFYTKEPLVNEMWHEVMEDDFIQVPRLSRIYYDGKFLQYPLDPVDTFFKLGPVESFLIFCSMVNAKINQRLKPQKEESNFEEWVTNRFGKRLFNTFFKTYTEKVWGIPCTDISADWAAQRISGLSLKRAVMDAFSKKQDAKSLIRKFEYPRLGPGMMWEKFVSRIEAAGGEVAMNSYVSKIYHKDRHVTMVEQEDGTKIVPEQFISSMPLRTLLQQLSPRPPEAVMKAAAGLKYRDFLVVALFVNQKDVFPDNWIYIHCPEVGVGRVQNFKNWSVEMVPDPDQTCLGMEYFCHENDGLWDTSDEDLIKLATVEAEQIGLLKESDVFGGKVIRQPKAYPVYDESYRENVDIIAEYVRGWDNMQTIGRNGMHRYNNQDHSMMTGILAIENLKANDHNLWGVNTERSYQETLKIREVFKEELAAQ
jgi:protoporphyrinogen oxidase